MEFEDAAVHTEEMATSVIFDGENDEFRGSESRSQLPRHFGSELTGNHSMERDQFQVPSVRRAILLWPKDESPVVCLDAPVPRPLNH
jgi:hypothetical protein